MLVWLDGYDFLLGYANVCRIWALFATVISIFWTYDT